MRAVHASSPARCTPNPHRVHLPCRFFHSPAERTGLPDAAADLVSCCLVMHELPQRASRAIVTEAFRLLRPGGTLAIMVWAVTSGWGVLGSGEQGCRGKCVTFRVIAVGF